MSKYIENDITDRVNSYQTTALKEKYVVKFDTLSVLDTKASIVQSPIFSPYREDVVKTLKFASKAYMLKTSQMQNGTIIYDGRPYTASNLPIKARFEFYYGYWMYKVLNSTIRGKSVKDLLCQIPNTPSPVFDFYYDFRENFVAHTITGFSGETLKSYTGRDSNPSAKVVDLYEAWLANLKAAVKNILSVYSDTVITNPSSFSTCIEVASQMADILSKITFVRNDERFATYLTCMLQNYRKVYARIFGDQDEKDPKYSYIPSKLLNLREHQMTKNLLFEDFKSWLNEQLYIEDFENECGLLKMDFERGFKYSMTGGTISLDPKIFEQLVDMAALAPTVYTQERNDLSYQLERFESQYTDLAKAYTICCLNKKNCKIPSEIGVLIPRETFDVAVGKDWDSYLANLARTCDELNLVMPYFTKFVKTCFYRSEGKRLFPNVSVRKRLYQGLDELYRFHFYTPQQRVYTAFKIEDYNSKEPAKSRITLVDMFTVGGSNVLSHDDGPGLNYLNQNYVTTTLDRCYIENWVDQLLYHRLFRVSDEVYRAEYDENFMTIKPNALGKKPELLIRNSASGLREASGYDYVAEPVSANFKWDDSEGGNEKDRGELLLNLWFGFSYHEVTDPSQYETLYMSRLSMLGTPSSTPIATEYTSFVGEKKSDVNWKALLSVVGTRFASLKKNTFYIPLVHSFETADEICDVKGIRSLQGSMKRYVQIPVPVPKEGLTLPLREKYNAVKSSKTRTEIARSLDHLWDYEHGKDIPRFVLYNEDFDCEKGSMPDSLLGMITLDLASDVRWGQLYGINAPNDKTKASNFKFKVRPPVSSASCVDPELDDRFVIFAGLDKSDDAKEFQKLRVVEDWTELFASTLQDSDVLITIGNVLRNIFLEIFDATTQKQRDTDTVDPTAWTKAQSDFNTLMKYIDKYYEASADILFEGAVGTINVSSFKSEVIDKPAPSFKDVVKYFESLYGNDVTLRAEKPAFDYYNYAMVLNSSENNEVLLPLDLNRIDVNMPAYSRNDFKDIDTLTQLSAFFIKRRLSKMLREAIK